LSHSLDVGAARLRDALCDGSYESGVFYASALRTLTGPVIDQAQIAAQLADPEVQDNAYEAIQHFVGAAAREDVGALG
jgi:hypothetical protein